MNRHRFFVKVVLLILVLIPSASWATTYYVDPNGDDGADGLSWSTAFRTIYQGVDTAINGDIVEVNEGTYYETVNFDSKTITLTSTDPNDWDVVDATIIDANNSGNAVTFSSVGSTGSVLKGFTIQRGANGISCSSANSPTIERCIITNNTSQGISCSALGTAPTITNNIIHDNTYGAGIFCSISSAPVIRNNVIYNNKYGIRTVTAGSVEIRNNTVVNNSTNGIYKVAGLTALTISNCIIWHNNDDVYNCTATFSCIENDDSGFGNISSYPYFKNWNGNNFHLTINSPCINKGDPNGNYEGQTDIDGEDRVADEESVPARVDMGADEFSNHIINLVKNPGFEEVQNGQPTHWTNLFGTILLDSNEKHSGIRSWKFQNGGYARSSDYIKVNPAEMYRFSAWIKSANGNETVYFEWQEYKEDLTPNPDDMNSIHYVVCGETIPADWTLRWKDTKLQHGDTAYIRIFLYAESGTVWWDDFNFCELTPSTELYNPDFEVNSGGRPHGWTSIGNSSLDSDEHSGNYSWKFVNDTADPCFWNTASSDFIAVDPMQFYRLSAWTKSANGTENLLLGWLEYDANFNEMPSDARPYFVLPYSRVPTKWTFVTGTTKAINSNTAYIRVLMYGPFESIGTVWWDDFNLVPINPEECYLPKYGYENSPAAKSIDFGSNTDKDPCSHGGIIWSPDTAMGERTQISGDPNYRVLRGDNKLVALKIPAFNVDVNGFPLSPMLLEIAYKDTVNSSSVPFITSRIDFYSDDLIMLKEGNLPGNPDSYYTNWGLMNYAIGSIRGTGDGKWKYLQYTFSDKQFQLIRSIDGYFTFFVINVKNTNDLPIDYVSLRKVTSEEYNAFQIKHRDNYGFYNTEITDIGEGDPNNYANPNLVVFVRDLMEPVYEHTRPKQNEDSNVISSFSFADETEPLSFAIYSKDGLSDLTVGWENENLTNSQNDSIPAPVIYQVVSDDRRLVPAYWKLASRYSYGYIPDRLEEFDSITISPDSSVRFWMKVPIPLNTPTGTYKGTILVKQNGSELQKVNVSLIVHNMALQLPYHINPVCWDPFYLTCSTDINEVLDLYSETGFDPFYFITNEAIEPIIDDGEIVDYDVSIFEERLERMIGECFAKKTLIVELYYSWQDKIYARFFGGGRPDLTDPNDLWDNLSGTDFVNAMKLYIQTLNQVAVNHNLTFIYSVTDEPGEDAYKRIIADRIYTIIHDVNSLTTVTYYTSCDEELAPCDPISDKCHGYKIKGGYDVNIPPLTGLVDYKVWESTEQGQGYSKGYEQHYGYYTTNVSYLRNPIYNRFLHGLLAYATDAEAVSAYAVNHYNGNPYNDFDIQTDVVFPYNSPDYLFAYPTWTGEIIPAMNLEGIREGIKDAKYIATLEALIDANPNYPIAQIAAAYLGDIKGRINKDFWNAYPDKSTPTGYCSAILQDLSETSDSNDFETFTRIRKTIAGYIILLSSQAADTDLDGMSDEWELAVCLNPNDANDRNDDRDDDGHTNLEEYLNWLLSGEPVPVNTDLNCDDIVNGEDFSAFANSWLTSSGKMLYSEKYDFDRDDEITISDLLYIAQDWLTAGREY